MVLAGLPAESAIFLVLAIPISPKSHRLHYLGLWELGRLWHDNGRLAPFVLPADPFDICWLAAFDLARFRAAASNLKVKATFLGRPQLRTALSFRERSAIHMHSPHWGERVPRAASLRRIGDSIACSRPPHAQRVEKRRPRHMPLWDRGSIALSNSYVPSDQPSVIKVAHCASVRDQRSPAAPGCNLRFSRLPRRRPQDYARAQ